MQTFKYKSVAIALVEFFALALLGGFAAVLVDHFFEVFVGALEERGGFFGEFLGFGVEAQFAEFVGVDGLWRRRVGFGKPPGFVAGPFGVAWFWFGWRWGFGSPDCVESLKDFFADGGWGFRFLLGFRSVRWIVLLAQAAPALVAFGLGLNEAAELGWVDLRWFSRFLVRDASWSEETLKRGDFELLEELGGRVGWKTSLEFLVGFLEFFGWTIDFDVFALDSSHSIRLTELAAEDLVVVHVGVLLSACFVVVCPAHSNELSLVVEKDFVGLGDGCVSREGDSLAWSLWDSVFARFRERIERLATCWGGPAEVTVGFISDWLGRARLQ